MTEVTQQTRAQTPSWAPLFSIKLQRKTFHKSGMSGQIKAQPI